MKKIFITILSILLPTLAFAGDVVLELRPHNSNEIKVGDELLLSVQIETGEEFYNAIGGKMVIPSGVVIRRITIGSSIISAWIKNPTKANSNEIEFEGIVAGGFKGDGKVFDVVVTPTSSGNKKIFLENVSIFLNDGLGTEIKKTNTVKSINVRSLLPGEENSTVLFTDNDPPEPFSVTITKDENIAEGKWVLIFEAIDKGTGVMTYEVTEGRKVSRDAQSPYIIKNQNLNERIVVKAIDHAGNERIVKVDMPEKICVGAKCIAEEMSLIIIILAILIVFVIWRKQSKELKKIRKGF